MRRVLIAIIAILFLDAGSQPPARFYTKFGGEGDDIGYSGKPTLDGKYIVVGSTTSYGNGNTDIYLVKVDSMGPTHWERAIGGFGNDVGKSVIQLPDTGFVIAGFTNSYGDGGYDAFIVRTDKSGNVIWQKTFGGQDWDFANDLVQSSDGGIVVVGHTFSFGSGKKDGFALKYDMLGNLIWKKFFGGVENEELRSVIKTNDGLLATVGYTESREINGDGWFLKLNLGGDTVFTRTFGGPYQDYASDVVHMYNDEYVICGAKTFSTDTGNTHSYFYRISTNGSFIFDAGNYASNGDENYISITTSSKLIALTPFLRNVPVPDYKMNGNVFVTYHNGYEYAINSFGGYEDEFCYSIEGTRDGGYVVLGSTYSFNSQGLDVYMIKLDTAIVLTYTNVIGIKENEINQQPLIYYSDYHTVKISLLGENSIKSIYLIDLNGRIIKGFDISERIFEINLSEFPNPVLIIRFNYTNGYYSHSKLINK